MSTIEEQSAAYESAHHRIEELVRGLSDERLATMVPCCPLWSVKDVVGHLTGVLEDRRDGNMPTGSFHDWTSAQVARHHGEDIATILDRWNEVAATTVDGPPSLASLSFDVVTHEHDIFQALGVAGDRDSDSVRVGAERARFRMSSMLVEGSAPGVLVTTEDGTHHAEGVSDPLSLETTRYSFMRLTTGRMSRSQAESLGWSEDPAPVLDALYTDGFFTLAPNDIIEADAN